VSITTSAHINIEGEGEDAISYANPNAANNLDLEVNQMLYNIAIFVFSSCGSGTAIYGTDDHPDWNLKDWRRIIITSSEADKKTYQWDEWPPFDYSHIEFLWNDENNGFVYALTYEVPISLYDAYNSGCNAAADWPLTSLPQLDDPSAMCAFTYL